MLKTIYKECKRKEVTGAWRKLHTEDFTISAVHYCNLQIKDEINRKCAMHEEVEKLIHNSVQRNKNGRDHLEDLGTQGQYSVLQRHGRRVWNGFIWLRTENSGGLL